MQTADASLVERITSLERRCRRANAAFAGLGACAVMALVIGASPGDKPADKPQEIVVSRLTVVDDAGQTRLVIGQDPKGVNRISRGAGLWVYDKTGAERGGFTTMDDNSVILAMDAPRGVGHPMPDRLGLKVWPNGVAQLSLLNNETGIPVRLVTDEKNQGGIEFIDYDMPNKKAFIKRIGYKGESKYEMPL